MRFARNFGPKLIKYRFNEMSLRKMALYTAVWCVGEGRGDLHGGLDEALADVIAERERGGGRKGERERESEREREGEEGG